MAHQHGHARLVQRQRDFINTNVVVVTDSLIPSTARNLVQSLIAPVVRSHSVSPVSEAPEQEPRPVINSRKPSQAGATPTGKPSNSRGSRASPGASGLMTASATATAAAGASEEGGMSTAAKAGLALGALAIIGVILVAILVLCRRKKNKKKAAIRMENEKANSFKPTPPALLVPANAASPPSAAPRLSLRPVTQFDPPFSEQNKSPNNLQPGAGPSVDPFRDPSNPFANGAAIDSRQAHIPDSPPSTAPPYNPTQPAQDFANPARAIAAADRGPSPEDFPAPQGPMIAMPGGPYGPPSGPNNVHRIQLDFKATMADELNLQAGQLVRMLHEYDDGWALCTRMDRSQQGVVPRSCLSKYPVKPRTGPPRQGPPPPGMRGPPIRSPMGPGGVPQPRSNSPPMDRNSPSQQNYDGPAPTQGPPRGRSNSSSPPGSHHRPMSPALDGRRRSSSANQAGMPRRGPGLSPTNPNSVPIPARKPVPGMAI